MLSPSLETPLAIFDRMCMLVLWHPCPISPWVILGILAHLPFVYRSFLLHSWGRKYSLCVVGLVIFLILPIQPSWTYWVPNLENISPSYNEIYFNVHSRPLQGDYWFSWTQVVYPSLSWFCELVTMHILFRYIFVCYFAHVIIFIFVALVFMLCIWHSWGLDAHSCAFNTHSWFKNI